jgi:2',5'-phosphodiesterase
LGDWQRFDEKSQQQQQQQQWSFLTTIWSMIAALCLFVSQTLLRRRAAATNVYKLAADRHNVIVCVRLRPKGAGSRSSDDFCVANYHMPCAFQVPQLMTIHAALAAQFVHRFSSSRPYVLAGDFNFKPHDEQYQLYKRGSLQPTSSALPPPFAAKNHKWQPVLAAPLRSAYFEALGSEPAFTNWSQVKAEPVFKETLDYIFLSAGWRVDAVRDLDALEIDRMMPSEDQPSGLYFSIVVCCLLFVVC